VDIWEGSGPHIQAFPCSPGAQNQQWIYNITDHSVRGAQHPDSCLSLTSVVPSGIREVWAGPLADGSSAVVLLNRHDTKTLPITANWIDIGLSGSAMVRDLWAHNNIGTFSTSYTANIAPHSVQFLRITPQ